MVDKDQRSVHWDYLSYWVVRVELGCGKFKPYHVYDYQIDTQILSLKILIPGYRLPTVQEVAWSMCQKQQLLVIYLWEWHQWDKC